MTFSLIPSALAVMACASLSAFAGTPAAPVAAPAAAIENAALADSLGVSLEAGFDSRYYHRGLYLADNMLWTGLSVSIPVYEKLSLNLSALYTTTVETPLGGSFGKLDFSELDLSAGLTYDLGFAKAGLVYTHYEYFDTLLGSNGGISAGESGEGSITGTNEVGLTLATTVGPVNLYGGFYYDFRIGGSYFELGADAPYKVTSWLTLVPAIKMGYGIDYYTNGVFGVGPASGFTHVIPSLSAPIRLTKTATVTPYVAYNFSLGARHAINPQDSEMFGGIKLSVTF